MARARNVKPGLYKNEDLAECSVWARYIFPGLWCLGDRRGRLEDRPKRIKGELLPFDNEDVEPLLQELHDRQFIIRYEVAGVRYIQILAFAKHQNPHHREAESEIPPPPGYDFDGNPVVQKPGAEHQLNDAKASGQPGAGDGSQELKAQGQPQASPGLAPPRSDLEGGSSRADPGFLIPDSLIPDSLIPDPPTNAKAAGAAKADPPAEFVVWWRLYPRKDSKPDALKAWKALAPNAELQALMLVGLDRWKVHDQWTKDDGKFIPLPASWLRGRRWEDQAVAQTPRLKSQPASRHHGFDQIDYTQGVNPDGSIPA